MVVRLADVAREAGVSQATASRVLNGSDRKPAEEIAARVRQAAERIGYVPNAQAQALARSSAGVVGLVGLIVHDIADPYFSSIARGVQHGLRAAGSQVLLASTERDVELELAAVRAFMSYRTDGIILAGSRAMDEDGGLTAAFSRYRENGGKVAMIGQPLDGTGGVTVDNRGGAAALARELLGIGHRRFIILAGDQRLYSARDRVEGFLGVLTVAGAEVLHLEEGEFTRDGGYAAMSRVLERWDEIDASGPPCIFGGNDVMVLGALTALRERGLSVPHDVAIAGFNDISTLRDMSPSITTVRLPLEEMGRVAAETLNSGDTPELRMMSGSPVLRASTARN